MGLIASHHPPSPGGWRLTASVSWLNECWCTRFSLLEWEQDWKEEGKERVVGDQKPRASRCRVTAVAGGCIFFLSRLKSLAERHSQVCSSFNSQKSSIFWRKSLWAGPGPRWAQSRAEAGAAGSPELP